MDNPVIFKEEKSKMIKRIYKAMRDLEVDPIWHEENLPLQTWKHNFPSKTLKRVKQLTTNV